MKKLCYVCNTFRLIRGFSGTGKRRNKVCNLCLFKSSRKMLYMDHEALEQLNLPTNHKTLTGDEMNYKLEQEGYWFEE